jgi:hypothetical protein
MTLIASTFIARKPTIAYPDTVGLQAAARLADVWFTRKFTKLGELSGLQNYFDVTRYEINV